MRERDRVEMQEEGQRGEGGRSGARHGDACFELLRAKRNVCLAEEKAFCGVCLFENAVDAIEVYVMAT